MRDFNQSVEEKWRKRRKKGYNWPRLVVMIIALAAILYGMSILQKSPNIVSEPMAEIQGEAGDALENETLPESQENHEETIQIPAE